MDRQGLFFATLLSTLLSLALCSNAILSSEAAVIGSENAEIWAFVWGHFWFKESLLNEFSWPMFTTLSNFPDGGTLWLKDPISLILMLPIQMMFDIPTAVLCSQILLFVLSGVFAFLLCSELGFYRWPSIIGGLIYAFCPHSLGEAFNGNIEAINTCWLAAWLFSWLRSMRDPDRINILLSSVFLCVLLVSNQYWALAMAMAAIPILGIELWTNSHRWKQLLKGALLSTLGGLLLFAPIAWWIWESLHAPNRLNDVTSHQLQLKIPYLSDLKHVFLPMSELTQATEAPPPFQDLVYPGFLLFFCALISPFYGRKTRWKWIGTILGLFFFVLSLGPALCYDGALVSINGTDMFALPWYYLTTSPALAWMTLPHRMLIPATLFLMIATVAVLNHRKYLGSILGIAIIAEFFLYPPYQVPLETAVLPYDIHAEILRDHPAKGAVLNLPINLHSNKMRIYYWYQSIHNRPIAMSLRYSEFPSASKQSNLLKAAHELFEVDRIKASSSNPSDPMEQQKLRDIGYRFIVLHEDFLPEFGVTEIEEYKTRLSFYLGEGIELPDRRVIYPLYPEDHSTLLQELAAKTNL